MNITATLNGESVTIVSINVDGSEIYISYVDSSSNLKTIRTFLNHRNADNLATTVIATGATIN